MAKSVELKNIGPIENVSIPIPEDGGIVILRGRNGKGKTTALEAVESALSGNGSLDVRDGALNGSVDAFGVTITVGRSTRRRGELEVESLEGKLSISDLIDPGLKTPDAADAKRIKALCSLAGVKADPALFYGIAGGKAEFESVVKVATLETDDVLLMAERIKRDYESKARDFEDQRQKKLGEAQSLKAQFEGIDVSAESDRMKLQHSIEVAIREEQDILAKAKAWHDAKKSYDSTMETLAGLRSLATDDAIPKQQAALDRASSLYDDAIVTMKAADSALELANQALAKAKAERTLAINAADTLLEQLNREKARMESVIANSAKVEELVAKLQTPGDPINPEDIRAKSIAVDLAGQAVEQGVKVRAAKEARLTHDAKIEDAAVLLAQSQRMRDIGKNTDTVLSSIVQNLGTPLRVHAGRLVLDTDRGETYLTDLSDGERAAIAVDIGLGRLNGNAVLTLNQRIFEGLDPQNRKMLHEHAKLRKVVILTAEASADDSITPMLFEKN